MLAELFRRFGLVLVPIGTRSTKVTFSRHVTIIPLSTKRFSSTSAARRLCRPMIHPTKVGHFHRTRHRRFVPFIAFESVAMSLQKWRVRDCAVLRATAFEASTSCRFGWLQVRSDKTCCFVMWLCGQCNRIEKCLSASERAIMLSCDCPSPNYLHPSLFSSPQVPGGGPCTLSRSDVYDISG